MGWEGLHDWRGTAASALDWWREAGVDVLVEEEPRDWLARVEPRRTPLPGMAPAEAVASVPAAALPATLDAFIPWRISDAAPEAAWGSPRIAPALVAGADLLLLLDMPEAEDEASGTLLSGPTGRLLDRMLAAIGRSRESTSIATLAVARPLAGQIPSDSEEQFGALALQLVGLAAPKKLLLLGQAASRAVLGTDGWNQRGGLRDVKHAGGTSVALASLHPRLLLERPVAKAEAWKHLQLIGGVCP